MQDRLIQRYLGNKAPLTPSIIEIVKTFAEPGDVIFDAFAGTLSVSAAFRAAGFRVAINDINHFTWTYARAYFSVDEIPPLDAHIFPPSRDPSLGWSKLLSELTAPFTKSIPRRARRSDIFDHYCEAGSLSGFSSSRGASGRRRFFSPENAIYIDRALSRIRFWHRECALSEGLRCLLMAILLSAVEKVSNTQGTYHDFPRAFMDPRALRPISLTLPSANSFNGLKSTAIGKARDTLDYILELPKHRAIYIDPPYNFRQYTSYYFMLNLLSEYPEIEDLDDYFSRVEYVRGQNMISDFKSPFCSKNTFLPALEQLIRNACADYVVISYFDGRNHWGQFKSEELDLTGRKSIEDLMQSDLFERGSAKCIPVERLNYQSYGGYAAKKINELIFFAKKRGDCFRVRELSDKI